MTLTRKNGDLFNSLPGLFDDMFTRNVFDWGLSNYSSAGSTLPAVNIKETTENFEVEMAAPGMNKQDFNVELEGNMLTITAEKKNEREGKEGQRYSRKEFSYQSFQRRFTLPKDVVDVDQIQAKYENGLLHLVIPKKEEAKKKPARLINIS
jgi:HSP20 family protein